jgi:hypothetical protein
MTSLCASNTYPEYIKLSFSAEQAIGKILSVCQNAFLAELFWELSWFLLNNLGNCFCFGLALRTNIHSDKQKG